MTDAWEAMETLPRTVYANPADRQQLIHELNDKGAVDGFRARFRRKNGAEVSVRITCRAVREADGRMLYLEGRSAPRPLTTRRARAIESHAHASGSLHLLRRILLLFRL